MKYLLNISYDGSKFYGFQIQKDKITICGELKKALSKIFNSKIKLIGASRTDKGVHAYNQYAHFDSDKIIDTKLLRHSLNTLVDKSISIKNVKIVNDNFNLITDIKMKEYIYKINTGIYNPLEKDYILQYNKKINISLLKKAIKLIRGTHDFTSFTSDKTKDNYIRTIDIKLKKKNNYIYIYFKSKGFLRYMIRNIIGLLLEINEGKKKLSDINNIFESKDRKVNAITASPVGLYLNKVKF